MRTRPKTPERGWVVLDQPPPVPSSWRIGLLERVCGWSSTQPLLFQTGSKVTEHPPYCRPVLLAPRQPCIRGMRVTVANVLRLLAAGHSRERILAAYPCLEPADLDACLLYASVRVEDEELGAVPA